MLFVNKFRLQFCKKNLQKTITADFFAENFELYSKYNSIKRQTHEINAVVLCTIFPVA